MQNEYNKSLKVTLSSTGVIMTSVAADGKERGCLKSHSFVLEN